jgi:hypothetical protein
VIRPGRLAVAKGIHVSELGNLILVCIREGTHTGDSAIVNGEGVKREATVRSTYIVHGLQESCF